ncbi:PVC-type heme-binding CxxCH protein [Roseimaritima sediminicola]|uniref:PVC-type heme-binding CxxCH protein n=1 Tax=Roseimaritima sediminicola TaxID=2662066 RepID=UPI001298375A|nr:PVC-type heme-binding CxxCH protein [Roseimaritima sediminicola]
MRIALFAALACVFSSTPLLGQNASPDSASSSQPSAVRRANDDRPIQALLVTGGCCHDYERQKRILTRGISARANVRWTVVHQGGTTTDTAIPLYNDPDWAEGFDIVVHNECFAKVRDAAFVDRILAPHRKGTPAILIHCAMHCYRVGDDRWFDFVGLRSPGHGPHYSFIVDNLRPDHPIMAGVGDSFVAGKGELYHTVEVFDSATPLAHAKRNKDGEPQVCVWTNDYHGTRVFATTIGHYNETMAQPNYLDMVTRGLLWAVGRDPAEHFKATDAETDAEIEALATAPTADQDSAVLPQNCCGDGNVAYEKPVVAKSTQNGRDAKYLTDGRLDTRWCPSGAQTGEWVVVDLQQPYHLRDLRLHWERREGVAYRYTVEGSADREHWETLVDASDNDTPGGVRQHTVDAADVRYLRVNFLGAANGLWGSLWELEAGTDGLADLSSLTLPVDRPVSVTDVKAPEGFEVRMFAQPPEVNYPVCLTTAAGGEVFVGVDEQGSLGKQSGGGRVLRCIDTDGDGHADQVNTFATMDHPRGLVYDNGSLWVLHPPYLTVYHDTDGDGVADESRRLIEGISTDEVARRGADHTTNGIRMGIDGWIYIAVGDFGFTKAAAADGTTLSRRGGGIVRIRPDGSNMEIFAWGLRNILDVSIDPFMNIFTRDNTNDGGGWDIRVSHILQSADYGYPSLYKNFTSEAMPPLADYGGGSGCGTMYFQDSRWPADYNDLLLTCDWGTSEVYAHRLPSNGPTFEAHQETFLKLPRPTDIDVDASGRMVVSSWKNGGFSYSNPNVGFVAQILPENYVPHPLPPVQTLDDEALLSAYGHESAAWRLTVQRELLRRAADRPEPFVSGLAGIAGDDDAAGTARAAAVFTLGQIEHPAAADQLHRLLGEDAVRAWVIRAATDSRYHLNLAPAEAIIAAMDDENPQVQAAAAIALGRLFAAGAEFAEEADGDGDGERSLHRGAAEALLSRSVLPEARPTGEGDDWRIAHPERVLPHLAVKALVSMRAIDACLDALGGPYQSGALWALKGMHDAKAVDGLFAQLGTVRDEPLRREIWTTLIRLYYREAPFEKGWWGTRPDTTGPYYDRATWSESERIAKAVTVALREADESMTDHLQEQLQRHLVKLGEDAGDEAMVAEEKAIELPPVDPNNPNQIANLPYEDVLARALRATGDADSGRDLFRSQSCINCHSFANGQQPKGPHLVDIGKRYTAEELIESMVLPSKKIAQGFDTWGFLMVDGHVYTGFVVLESAETVTIRQNDGVAIELLQDDIEERFKREESMMPKGVVDNLTPKQLADLVTYLQSLH